MQAEVRRHVEELEHVSSELRESLATITAEAGRRTEAERRLEQQLTHDGVTGLPNRLGITRRIDVCLRRDVDAVRGADARATGVAFVVLEDLRRVREALGHDTADDAARLVTSRLKAMAAQPEVAAVCTSAELGRAGEDEFVIVLASLDGADAGLRLADRFLEQLAQPIQVRGRQLALRPCLGLAAGRLQYERGSELLRDASTAADAARTKGGPSRVVFEPRMHLVARSRLELESNLRRAVEERQFHHLYQVVRALDGRLLGIAGGLRWENPQADAPEPRTFLPVVEACGLAPRFGTLALEQLLLDTATWSAPRGKTATFELELPAGPREIGDEGYARALVEAGETLAGHGFALAVRVEEAQLARSGFACEERLAALRASGVRVNLELATDVVSLALVQRMRPDGLRLPRELVARLHDDADTLAMVESLVACAHRLGVRVTAAGVDGARALELARQLGVDAVLGLHDGPPSSAAMVRARISGAPADGARA
ncbi:MAG: EAL domain-containing protein [Planctomycetes bacterium]|nr:EAL domain-containing protein [Planctomycetota bacterium]